MIKNIAFYLPQFHPIPENDIWWGKGFTEWTNVGKAKQLYSGHYQPHIPADLGYYDLRLPEVREAQASMAKDYGIDGFCYWHYWLGNGKRLLERPFNEVLDSKKPNFPFCLGWANHSWEAKNWSSDAKSNKLLIKQEYNGLDDCISHFNYLKTAFHDSRYIKKDKKPIIIIWSPLDLPAYPNYLKKWEELAIAEGFPGLVFIGFTYKKNDVSKIKELGFNYVLYDSLFDTRNEGSSLILNFRKLVREITGRPMKVKYSDYARNVLGSTVIDGTLPCILPNYDHTPRSGKRGVVLESDPQSFCKLLTGVFNNITAKEKDVPFVFIKSWNEWGEGNHLEPDLKYGRSYLEALLNAINSRN